MDTFQQAPVLQPEPAQDSPEPTTQKSILPIVLAMLLVIVLVVGAFSFFLFFTFSGQKFLNSFLPSTERTFSLVEKNMESTDNYHENITLVDGVGSTQVSKSVASSSAISLAVKLPTTITNSTVAGIGESPTNVVVINDKIYAQDPYDNSYYQIKTESTEGKLVNTLSLLSAKNITSALVEISNPKIELVDEGGSKHILITSNQVPESLLNMLGISKGTILSPKVSIKIDAKNYAIEAFSFETENTGSGIKKANVIITNYGTNKEVIAKPAAVNEFGSFVQRESKYIRTEPNGVYDYLWNSWEKKYFGCDKCVNPVWDEDSDGLNNIQEFIFGSNPLVADSNGNGIGDQAEVQAGKNPVTGTVLSEAYAKSAKQLAVNQIGAVGLGDTKIGNAFIRDSVSIIKKEYFYVPKNAKTLYFYFRLSSNPDNSAYFNVFFNNKLIFLHTLVPGEVVDLKSKTLAHVPIEQFAGQRGELAFILNSFGSPGGGIDVDLNTMRIDNNPVFPFLAY